MKSPLSRHRGLSFIPALRIGALSLLLTSATTACPPATGPSAPPGPTGPPTATATVPATAPTATPSSPSAGTMPDANMDRAKIPDRYKWQLNPVFASDAEFDKAIATSATMRAELAKFKGKLAQPKQLAACLQRYFETRLLTNKITLYAQLRADTDQKSSQLAAMHDRSLKVLRELMDKASFIRNEIMALDDRAMKRAYRAAPELDKYRPYLSELRRRRSRVLGADSERLLAMAGDNLWAEIDLNEIPSDVEKVFKSLRADMPLPTIVDEAGKPVQLTLANFGKYRASDNREVRRNTVESYFATLRRFENTYAATLSGQMRLNVLYGKARGYDTALDAYLDKDNIDPAVYRNLIKGIHANLAPLHRYVRTRKQLMGLDELHIYDLYAPMVKGASIKVPYAEAMEILPKALAPLGKPYLDVVREGLNPNAGWIDVFPHKNKASGAFCIHVYGVHPFVKMNYFNDVDDLSTLAHEYGHAIHSHLSMNTQPYITSSYTAFVAEIASTVNEKLLSDYLLANAKNDDERLFLLNNLVETIRTTIYRQALFAEFELAAHTASEKGKPLTAELLNKTYVDLIRKYYGPDFTIGANDALEWAYIPHFYYKYYVYSYASGLSAGIALADLVHKGGPKAREAYLGMLKGGSSKAPLELLKGAGVDLTKPEVYRAAAKLMDDTLAQMEAIIAKKRGK